MNRLLFSLLSRLNDKLFLYQVKLGFILCAVEDEGLPDGDNDDEEEQHNSEEENENENEEESNNEDEGEEVVVKIGDEEDEEEQESQAAPQWVKDLRKNHRETQKELKQAKEQLAALTGAKQKPAEVGTKPTLEACDYDAEKFEQELEAWHERKRQAEQAEEDARRQQEEQNRAWQEQLTQYNKGKSELKVQDYADAEDIVKDTLSITQQGIIIQGCKNPALVVYALGKNPKKAKELASIKDPVKYAFAIANLESQLKVTNRKSAPPPEKQVKGGSGISGAVDSQLERLREEAARTGDYSKVMAYKNQQRNKK